MSYEPSLDSWRRRARRKATSLLGASVDELTIWLEQLQDRLQRLEERISADRVRLRAHERDLARIGPQVAALEQRVEDVAECMAAAPVADSIEQEQARTLLEEVRREHARVRARVSSLLMYEERIRQLEDRVASLDARDRQPTAKN